MGTWPEAETVVGALRRARRWAKHGQRSAHARTHDGTKHPRFHGSFSALLALTYAGKLPGKARWYVALEKWYGTLCGSDTQDVFG